MWCLWYSSGEPYLYLCLYALPFSSAVTAVLAAAAVAVAAAVLVVLAVLPRAETK